MAKVDERKCPFSRSLGFNYAGQYDASSVTNSLFYIGTIETAYGYLDPISPTTDIDEDANYSDKMKDFIGFKIDENPEI